MCCRLRRFCLAAAGASLLLPAVASAQQSYRIALKEPAQGDTTLHHKLVQTRLELFIAHDQGKAARTRSLEETLRLVYRQTVLEKPAKAGQTTKLRQHFSRAERTQAGQTDALTYQGKALLIECKDGHWRAQTEDGVIPPRALAALGEEGNAPPPVLRATAAWLPLKPVRVGESWAIPVAPLLKGRDWGRALDFDAGRAEASGKLLRTYEKGGRRYGVFELVLSGPPRTLGSDGKVEITLKDSKVTVRLVVDGCIDGSRSDYRVKGIIEQTLNGRAERKDFAWHVQLQARIDFFESREEAGKE
jgi:hypothetical protein